MVKCPFCQYDNEEGALFCEQCKSDLGGPPVAASARGMPAHSGEAGVVEPFAALGGGAHEPPHAEAVPAASPFDFPEAPPLAAPVEPPMTAPFSWEPPLAAIPVAEVAPALPPHVEPSEAAPFVPLAEAVFDAPAAETQAAAPEPLAPAPLAPPAEADRLPEGAQPKLVVLRGLKINAEFPLYEGHNFIGRADEKPVDIDLEDQEPPDRIWSSRQHAVIAFEDGRLIIEDLNSANGTFVNRSRIHPGQKRPIKVNDIIQIGTVQLKVKNQ